MFKTRRCLAGSAIIDNGYYKCYITQNLLKSKDRESANIRLGIIFITKASQLAFGKVFIFSFSIITGCELCV